MTELAPTGERRQPPARTQATKAPVRKVVAATAGAGLGAATSDLVIGGMADLFNSGHPLPLYLSTWLAVVIPALVAAAAGYLTPRAPGE